jgi:putative transcriptional regulator
MKTSIGTDIIAPLQDAINFEQKKDTAGVRVTKISISPLPHFKAKDIKLLRNQIGLSQVLFAKALGISVKTVESWESGINSPSGIALRMLDLIKKDHNLLEKFNVVQSGQNCDQHLI